MHNSLLPTPQEWIAEYKVKRAAEDADFRASEEAKAALEAQKEKVGCRRPCTVCPNHLGNVLLRLLAICN